MLSSENFSDVLVIAIISPKAKIVQIKTSPSWISPTKFWTPLFIFFPNISKVQNFCQQTRKIHEKISRTDISSRKKCCVHSPHYSKSRFFVRKCNFVNILFLFIFEFSRQKLEDEVSKKKLNFRSKSLDFKPKLKSIRWILWTKNGVLEHYVLKNLLNFSSEESSQKQSKCHLKCISTNKGSLLKLITCVTWWHDPVITD